MLSKSIIAASLLLALAPSTVLGARATDAVELDAPKPTTMAHTPLARPGLGLARRPIANGRRWKTRDAELKASEPMRVRPAVHFGRGALKTREYDHKPSARRLAHLSRVGHSSVDMGMHHGIRARNEASAARAIVNHGIHPVAYKAIRVNAREFDDEALEARQPIFGLIKKIGKGILGRDLQDLDARELEELEARQPIFGLVRKVAKGIFGRDLEELDARELEELEARTPIFGLVRKVAKGIFGRDLEDLDAREWEELEARTPIFGMIKRIGKGIFGRDLEGLDAREWEELEARQPIFRIIKKVAKGILGRDLEDLDAREWEEVLERTIELHHHHHTRELEQLD